MVAEDKERLTATIDAINIDVAKPYYAEATREAAASLFSHDLYNLGGATFNAGATAATKTALQARQNALTGNDSSTVDKLPRDIFQQWGYEASLIDRLNNIDP